MTNKSSGIAIVFIVCASFFVSCVKNEKVQFQIPSGESACTLRAFAEQADAEIVFNSSELAGIRTNPVEGEMRPYRALDRLLQGTGLEYHLDSTSDAIAIVLK